MVIHIPYPKNAHSKFIVKHFIYEPIEAIVLFVVFRLILLCYLKYTMCFVTEKSDVSFYISKEYDYYDIKHADNMLEKSLKILAEKSISLNHHIDIFVYFDESVLFKIKPSWTGANLPIFRMIYLNAIDFVNDYSTHINNDERYSQLMATKVMAHELTHSYEWDKLGIIKSVYVSLSQNWKIEGFADYVANQSDVNTNMAKEYFIKDNTLNNDLRNFWGVSYNIYFLGRLRTDYLLRHKGIPEDEYWETEYDTDKLDDEIREALQSGEYRAFEQ